MPNSEKLKELVNGKRVSILGIGVSNTPLIDMLLGFGATVTAHDMKTKEKLGALADSLESKGVKLKLGSDYLDEIDADVIFKSPGIRFDKGGIPDAVKKGAYLTSEMQVFFELCPARIIAVTGSDGKTTTTTLISEILKADGKNVFVGGNIGRPLLPVIDEITATDFVVLELSSFQLHKMTRSPDVAVITNITPNHLDWHTDMQEYIDAKLNILNYQKSDSLSVLNYQNEHTREAANIAKGMVTYFSSASDINGVHLVNGVICYGNEPVLDTKDILIPGKHNIENFMAAIGALYGTVRSESIVKVANTFKGVEHRIELVRELDGVKYYNSSIDSSPTRTIAALRSFKQKLIVLCGGYDKHLDYSPLAPVLCERAKTVIITGATKDKIKDALLGYEGYETGSPEIYETADYGESVALAHKIAKPGDIVILSPASASFDAFTNFMERGKFFKEKVNEL